MSLPAIRGTEPSRRGYSGQKCTIPIDSRLTRNVRLYATVATTVVNDGLATDATYCTYGAPLAGSVILTRVASERA